MLGIEIIVRQIDWPLAKYEEYAYKCIFCGEEIIFYSLSPRICPCCEKKLPDMLELINNKVYRTKYHFSGGQH